MPLASIAWLIYLQITRSVRVVLLSIAMTVFEFSGSYICTPFGVSNLPYRIFGSTLKACSPNIR